MTLWVGGPIADITPARQLPNDNGAGRYPGAPEGALRCQAMTVADRHITVAIVAVDATFLDRPLVLRSRDACALRAAAILPGACGNLTFLLPTSPAGLREAGLRLAGRVDHVSAGALRPAAR